MKIFPNKTSQNKIWDKYVNQSKEKIIFDSDYLYLEKINESNSPVFFVFSKKTFKCAALKRICLNNKVEKINAIYEIYCNEIIGLFDSPFFIKMIDYNFYTDKNNNRFYAAILLEECEGNLQDYLTMIKKLEKNNFEEFTNEKEIFILNIFAIISSIIKILLILFENNLIYGELKIKNLLIQIGENGGALKLCDYESLQTYEQFKQNDGYIKHTEGFIHPEIIDSNNKNYLLKATEMENYYKIEYYGLGEIIKILKEPLEINIFDDLIKELQKPILKI